jgi:glycosyltransferase involved in cell wall biosynthesis
MGAPLFDGQLYGAALDLLAHQGRAAFGHVDTILFHSSAEYSAKSENAEFEAARLVLKLNQPDAQLTPLPRLGTWLLQSPAPVGTKVSVVVTTGTQTGYLSSLLVSLVRYGKMHVDDVVLVCQEDQYQEVELVATTSGLNNIRIVTLTQANYNHSRALNAGVAQAVHEFILIADDDTELLQLDGLMPMLGILSQGDVACVAPRLVTSIGENPKIVAGPAILGVGGGAGTYLGESQGLAESGVYSRLQLSQDVSAVSGHFFLMKRVDWQALSGFDETTFSVFNCVLDFCLKLNGMGKRHVWTPLTNVLHQGGKTLEVRRRDILQKIVLAEQEISERRNLHARWSKQLANDPYYNRHLSLIVPFDVEADIVVDWQPKRHDRPRVLALPMHSGAGQYRVVEPLNALQDAGLAQTSVVLPFGGRRIRLMQPLELVRAAPDRLILQHSVDDGQLSLIDGFKNAAPDIKIIQTVDDLLGEVSEKHPNHQYQIREGHSRMRQALTKSDRLIVTTQTLADHYKKYVDDVHIVPNTLGPQWVGLRRPPETRSRLRVGWVGAGQHHGDLELINHVVRELAAKVDWVFMGMCTDEIKPLLKEFHGFVSIGDYPKKMSELDLDIALAPIEDNFFNRCKSNLRLLEYGAMGWPVVCSDVFPYQTDDPPVIRVKNDPREWVQAIESLFDVRLRHAKAEALHQWVMTRFLLESKCNAWYEAVFG